MDPYVYPGTSVLRNLRDIRDPKELAAFEAESTGRRLKELRSNPIGGSFDAKHLRAVHGHIFQDIYAWAGQFRTVNIARSGQFYFAFASQIDPSVTKVLGELHEEKRLKRLAADEFSQRAGHYLGELNAIHPFRDGNGRTQREFIRQLGLDYGYILRWSRVSPEQMREASLMSFQSGDNVGMADLVRAALEKPKRTKERSSNPKAISEQRLNELRKLAQAGKTQREKDNDRERD